MRPGKTLLISVFALLLTPVSHAGSYSFSEVAAALAKRDEQAGNPMEARRDQFETMIERAGKQCKQSGDAEDTAGGVAMMLIASQKKLAQAGVSVTSYELLDVLFGLMGDGAKNWDCASALSMYISARTGNPVPAQTHIAAYKLLQAFRDSGLLGQSR